MVTAAREGLNPLPSTQGRQGQVYQGGAGCHVPCPARCPALGRDAATPPCRSKAPRAETREEHETGASNLALHHAGEGGRV